jgi:hypothetical protein
VDVVPQTLADQGPHALEQFHPELRKNKELERFRVSVKNGNALAAKSSRECDEYFGQGSPKLATSATLDH